MRDASDYIVFPLDVPDIETAERLTRNLADAVGMFKIGLELFIKSGPEGIDRIRRAGARRIFLDLKLHDIPKTVERAMAVTATLNVDYVTVHCGEDNRMLEAAVHGGGERVGVLGVTVLTSVSAEDLALAGYRESLASEVFSLVRQRAEMAHKAGCRGVICSGKEVARIKKEFGGGLEAMTPGIRPAWDAVAGDDQRRVVTPAMAVADGADYIVIGRPIRDADDPAAAARRVAEEIGGITG
jgi:orotidine-5'-phosphate decarboxylase